jgi:hypothetical protein
LFSLFRSRPHERHDEAEHLVFGVDALVVIAGRDGGEEAEEWVDDVWRARVDVGGQATGSLSLDGLEDGPAQMAGTREEPNGLSILHDV